MSSDLSAVGDEAFYDNDKTEQTLSILSFTALLGGIL